MSEASVAVAVTSASGAGTSGTAGSGTGGSQSKAPTATNSERLQAFLKEGQPKSPEVSPAGPAIRRADVAKQKDALMQNADGKSKAAGEPPNIFLGDGPRGWQEQNALVVRAQADKAGLTPQIEKMFAEGLTSNQVLSRLDSKLGFIPPEDRPFFIVGTRSTLGIPSRMGGDNEGFTQWKAQYDERTKAKESNLVVDAQPAPQVATAEKNTGLPILPHTPDPGLSAPTKGLREVNDGLNTAASYAVPATKDRKPDEVVDISGNPKGLPGPQNSSKEGLDRMAGPAGPPDDYWFPPGASTTRPNVNRNAPASPGGSGAATDTESLTTGPSKTRSDSAQINTPAEAVKGATIGAASGMASAPSADQRDASSRPNASSHTGNDQSLKSETAGKPHIPSENPKSGQQTAFEGVNDWVRRDLIEYHRHDPVKGRNFFESMLLIPHNKEKAELQDHAAMAMGVNAFQNAEYAKLLQAARPDIIRNYADEKTRATAVATETVDRKYGDALRPNSVTPGVAQPKSDKTSTNEFGPSKSAGIKKGVDENLQPAAVKHPYVQGRERASTLEKIRKGATHFTFGIAGGYAINKVIDHYSKPPTAPTSSVSNFSKAAAEAKQGHQNISPSQPKAGGRKM